MANEIEKLIDAMYERLSTKKVLTYKISSQYRLIKNNMKNYLLEDLDYQLKKEAGQHDKIEH